MLKSKSANEEKLQNRINELETQLNQLANDTGNVIIKQLPDGKFELNGEAFDNSSEVQYYNSSKATYGELTMFRIASEVKQKEINKLIDTHTEICDNFEKQIQNLKISIENLNSEIANKNIKITSLERTIDQLNSDIDGLKNVNKNNRIEYENLIDEIKYRYETVISQLEKDVETWKRQFLTFNAYTGSEKIKTRFGEIL